MMQRRDAFRVVQQPVRAPPCPSHVAWRRGARLLEGRLPPPFLHEYARDQLTKPPKGGPLGSCPTRRGDDEQPGQVWRDWVLPVRGQLSMAVWTSPDRGRVCCACPASRSRPQRGALWAAVGVPAPRGGTNLPLGSPATPWGQTWPRGGYPWRRRFRPLPTQQGD